MKDTVLMRFVDILFTLCGEQTMWSDRSMSTGNDPPNVELSSIPVPKLLPD